MARVDCWDAGKKGTTRPCMCVDQYNNRTSAGGSHHLAIPETWRIKVQRQPRQNRSETLSQKYPTR
jgi:hypothetical protein